MALNYRALPLSTGKPILNFNVVGGLTQPTNPKENTIWVNTENTISKWILRPDSPIIESNNRNTIIYPYVETTKTDNGITFTDNGDGSITVNGTATADASMICTSGIETTAVYMTRLSKGTYTISGNSSNTSYSIICTEPSTFGSVTFEVPTTPYTFTVTKELIFRMYLKVKSGTTVNNEICYPQIEKGTEATSYIKGDISHLNSQVWIKTLNKQGTVSFNALKSNIIDTQLDKIYQWSGSEWVKQEAYIYRDGEWQQFSFLESNIFTIIARATKNSTTATTSNVITNTDGHTTIVIDNVVATGGNYGKNRARLYVDNAVVLDTTVRSTSASYKEVANAWSGSFPISQNGTVYADIYTKRDANIDDNTNSISITVNFHFE